MVNEQERFIGKKAYEIAYALFRISGKLSAQILGRYIENHCLSLFDSAMYGNKDAAAKESQIIEYYLRLAGDIGLIHQDNVSVTIYEIGKLNSAIAELPKAGAIEHLKLHFSQAEPKVTADIQKKEIPAEIINKEIEAIANAESGNAAEQPVKTQLSNIELRQSTRQAAIIDKIRQLPNCRMKELQDSFPAVSERTLRYDIEKLLEKGLIERVGPGGPATSYRVKDAAKLAVGMAEIAR